MMVEEAKIQQLAQAVRKAQAEAPLPPERFKEFLMVNDWAWRAVDRRKDGTAYRHRVDKEMTVILTLEHHAITKFEDPEGQWWLHISVARPKRIPSYKDMQEVLRVFGGDRGGLQVFPKRSEHVNIHPYCLHWWVPLERWPLPDFTKGTGSI